MKSTVGQILFGSMLTSTAIIVAGITLVHEPVVMFAAALLPLVIYHLIFLLPRAKRGALTAVEIDSIYYYGFLMTIVALAASTLTIVFSGIENSLPAVGAQFGLGLLATGYAVAARIHLLMTFQMGSVVDEDTALDAYVARARELVSSIELATSSFEAYAKSLEQRAVAAAETSQARSAALIDHTASIFRDGVSVALHEATASIAGIRDLLTDASFRDERSALKKSVGSSVEALSKLNSALAQMGTAAEGSVEATTRMAAGMHDVSAQSEALISRLDPLSGDASGFAVLNLRVAAITSQLQNCEHQFGTAGERISLMAGTAKELTTDLGSLQDAVRETGALMKPMASAVSGIDQVNRSLRSSADALTSVQSSAAAASSALNYIQPSIDALLPFLSQLGQAGAQAVPTFEALHNNVSQLQSLASALSPVTQSMASAADLLDKQAEQVRKAISANDELLASMMSSIGAAPELHALLTSIPASLGAIEVAMSETSSRLTETAHDLDTAVSSATTSLAQSTSAASEYVKRVGESFIGLAGFIIRETGGRASNANSR